MKQIKVQCPAKINLTLKVLGKREDGFHNIESVMQTLNLFDFLTISVEKNASSEIVLSGNSLDIPYDEKNLVYKAVDLYMRETGMNNYKVSVYIEKNIPISAGLAGGSTDGAGALYGLNRLFDDFLTREQLHKLCAKLGSDLNFCLEGGKQKTLGRGEILEKLPFEEFDVSLIKPINLGISAKEAYTKFSNKIENMPPTLTLPLKGGGDQCLDIGINFANRTEETSSLKGGGDQCLDNDINFANRTEETSSLKKGGDQCLDNDINFANGTEETSSLKKGGDQCLDNGINFANGTEETSSLKKGGDQCLHKYTKFAQQKSIELRKNMTDAEQKLWSHIRKEQLNGYKFRRQQPIGPFVVDFVCLPKKLILEIDGGQHNSEECIKTDNQRTIYLESKGFTILRFWNNEIFDNIQGVLEQIINTLNSISLQTLNLRENYVNDLEWAIIDDYKELQKLKVIYPNAVMSGSGSTYFGIDLNFDELDGYWIKNGLKSISHGVLEVI